MQRIDRIMLPTCQRPKLSNGVGDRFAAEGEVRLLEATNCGSGTRGEHDTADPTLRDSEVCGVDTQRTSDMVADLFKRHSEAFKHTSAANARHVLEKNTARLQYFGEPRRLQDKVRSFIISFVTVLIAKRLTGSTNDH